MRIAYVCHTRFPTEKAHGYQVAHVCAACAALGHDVTLLAPAVGKTIRRDPFRYYGIDPSFSVEWLPAFDALNAWFVPGRLAFLFTMRSFKAALRRSLAEQQYDLLYVRSPAVLPPLLVTGVPVVLELHTLPRYGRRTFVRRCNACRLVVCLTRAMCDELVSWGVDAARVVVEGDAVDLSRFRKMPSAETACHHFNLPDDRPVVGYLGSLVTFDKLQKGIPLLIDAVVKLRKQGVSVQGWIVGGPEHWRERYRKLSSQRGLSREDICFREPVPQRLVPDALAACDVCVLPAPASRHPYFRRDTSPLKLFEYLAAGRPVVCADIPPLRGVVDSETVRFVQPGSATSLAGGIRDVLEHPDAARKRVRKGKQRVRKQTWKMRMQRILGRVSG